MDIKVMCCDVCRRTYMQLCVCMWTGLTSTGIMLNDVTVTESLVRKLSRLEVRGKERPLD